MVPLQTVRKSKGEAKLNKDCITIGQGGGNQRFNQQRGTGNYAAFYLYLDCVQLTTFLYDAEASKGIDVVFCLIAFLAAQGFSFWEYNKSEEKEYGELECSDKPSTKTRLREKVANCYRTKKSPSKAPTNQNYPGRQEAAADPPQCIKDAKLEINYAEMVNILWDYVQEYNENSNRLESVRNENRANDNVKETENTYADLEDSHVNKSGVCHDLPSAVTSQERDDLLDDPMYSPVAWWEPKEDHLGGSQTLPTFESFGPNSHAKLAAQTTAEPLCNHRMTLPVAPDKDEARTKTPESSVDMTTHRSLHSVDNEECGTGKLTLVQEYQVLAKSPDRFDEPSSTFNPVGDSLTAEQYDSMRKPMPDISFDNDRSSQDFHMESMLPDSDKVSTKTSESSVDAPSLCMDNEERSAVVAAKGTLLEEDQGPAKPGDSSVDLTGLFVSRSPCNANPVVDHLTDDVDANQGSKRRLQDEMEEIVEKYGYEACLKALERTKRPRSSSYMGMDG